jgi:AcrR family transcriptional regulator
MVSVKPMLRRDAQRNRDRILDAACRCFALRGLEICVDEIAQSAGVGVGTLYRRFPSKASLIQAILERRLDELQPKIDQALSDEDPWTGLSELMTALVAQQIADRGLSQLLLLRAPPDDLPEPTRRRFLGPLERLLARAQRAGRARPDVGARDLPAILRMASALALRSEEPGDWRRHVRLLLDGLAARAERPAPG